MGVGGLLMEIISRPQYREPEKEVIETDVTAIILAAGRSTRMGGPNKLLAKIGSKPLVRIAAEQALASRAESVVVVTGHQHEQVEEALQGLARRQRPDRPSDRGLRAGARRPDRHSGGGRPPWQSGAVVTQAVQGIAGARR